MSQHLRVGQRYPASPVEHGKPAGSGRGERAGPRVAGRTAGPRVAGRTGWADYEAALPTSPAWAYMAHLSQAGSGPQTWCAVIFLHFVIYFIGIYHIIFFKIIFKFI